MSTTSLTQQVDHLPGRKVSAVAAAATVFSALCVGAAALLLYVLGPGVPPARLMPRIVEPIQVKLFDRHVKLHRSWAATVERLETYHWVDRRRGEVDIPVEEGMKVWLSRHAGAGKGAP